MRYTGDTGAASACRMLAASSGETRSSASRQSTQSCFAWSTANCFWRPKPSHSFCTTRARCRAAMSSVPSLEFESMTTISSAKCRLSRQESSTAAALRVISTADSGARVGAAKLLSRKIAAANSKWLSPTFKVLFVKTSSLGDVVHQLPAVSDAARKLPGVEIDWIVEQPFAGVAAMHAAVRRVIPVQLRRWRARWWRRATWAEIADFRRAVRAERYDAVVDTQSLVKSALISSCALGPRHGMDAASAREPLAARFYAHRHAVPRALHAVERNRILSAAALRYSPDGPLDYGVQVPPADEDAGVYSVFLTMTS